MDDVFKLDKEKIMERKRITCDHFLNLKHKNNLVAQKVICKWLFEGDINSFFHRVMNKRRSKNEITGIILNGAWCEDVIEVNKGIHEFFQNHYR